MICDEKARAGSGGSMTREEFIKKKIKEKGMTLKDYARMIHMPYSTLAGNLGGASLDNVARICNGLDTSIGTMQSAVVDLAETDGLADLSDREKKLVLHYRASGTLQEAVDKLLDI
jgi:predicted transcriptional regulator